MPRKIEHVGEEMDLIFGDTHFPFQDSRYISLLFRILENHDFENIIANGDIFDCYSISKFLKDPALVNIYDFSIEREQVMKFLGDISEIQPDAKKIFITGNHEYRWYKEVFKVANDVSPLLRSVGMSLPDDLENPNFGDIIRLQDIGWEFWDKPNPERAIYPLRDRINVAHGWKASKHSAYTVKNVMDEHGGSWIVGHCHRFGVHYHTYQNRREVGVENGCLCLDLDYTSTPNWQRGFTIVHWDKNKHFRIEPIVWC